MKRLGGFSEATIEVLAKRVAYRKEHLGSAHEVGFSDFSGMTFYGDGSKRSTMSRSLDGRSRRLHEFISELDV